MKGKDEIKELFSEKLGNYEAKVNPDLWNNIASQIGATAATTAASTGISILTKWIIGASIASAVVVTTILVVNNIEEPVTTESQKTEQVAENKSLTEEKDQLPVEVNVEKKVVIDQHSVPTETGEETRQNVNNSSLDEKVPVINNAEENREAPVVIESPQQPLPVEIKVIKKTEQKTPTIIDPVIKEADPIIENSVVEHQTEDKSEATYKIGKLPNTFSPNRDGVHDIFFIESEGLEEFNIVILDVKNKVVFQSNDPNFKWDGNDLSGNPAPDGPNFRYIYYITARDINGSPVNKGSTLTINR